MSWARSGRDEPPATTSQNVQAIAVSERPRRPIWFDAAILGFALFSVFALCANYSGQQITDNVSVFTAAWAAGQNGTLDISGAPDIKPWTVLSEDGALYSDRAPGIIAWATPFYAALGRSAYPTIFPAGVAAASAAAIAMALLYALFRRLTTGRIALLATLLASFGTATWTISADAIWPHGPDQVWLVAMMLSTAGRHYLLAGFAAAAALLTRPISAVAVAAIGLTTAFQQRSWRPALAMGAASSLGLLCLFMYNRVVFGEWTFTAGSYRAFVGQFAGRGERYDPTDPLALLRNIAGALVSPTRGVLVMSPFVLALLPGIRSGWRLAPGWVRASALGGMSYALVQVWGNNFAGGGGFFSYRYTIESLTLLAPLLLLCWTTWTSQSRPRRFVFLALALFSVGQHVTGALYVTPSLPKGWSSWSHYLPVEALRAATPGEIAFVVLAMAVATATALTGLRRRRPHIRRVQAPNG